MGEVDITTVEGNRQRVPFMLRKSDVVGSGCEGQVLSAMLDGMPVCAKASEGATFHFQVVTLLQDSARTDVPIISAWGMSAAGAVVTHRAGIVYDRGLP